MATGSAPPWKPYQSGSSITHDYNNIFNITQSKLENDVEQGDVLLTQFPENTLGKTRELSWRHYMVSLTVQFVAKKYPDEKIGLVECGVCDGLTAYFSLNCVSEITDNFAVYLYDSWSAMKPEHLTMLERSRAGKYDYLSIENTKTI